MTFDAPLDHEALLTLARKVEAAAHDADSERLETTMAHLFEALVAHVGAERSTLDRLAPSESVFLLQGQQRVVDLLLELAAATQVPSARHCAHLASQLYAHLSVQADDERLAGIALSRQR